MWGYGQKWIDALKVCTESLGLIVQDLHSRYESLRVHENMGSFPPEARVFAQEAFVGCEGKGSIRMRA